ncbi:hypothetical protein HMPREF9370_1373 [Neisseria wadsworthii 9715]|uniref:Uncharacterized protein n=1 Tax=Neisseria wadsworthii 9715 TaxID=1030841 RepID=G4CQL3_9NEIS|nr:hypothetical protein HMPREF9370_1373 [Neisseria wadsworthii 9715]
MFSDRHCRNACLKTLRSSVKTKTHDILSELNLTATALVHLAVLPIL